MGLALKNLQYKEHRLSNLLSENVEPWYMRLNPKGEVPTLLHGSTIVCDSGKILRHLDETFTDTAVQLCPNESTDEWRRCKYFLQCNDKFDPRIYTLAAVVLPEITQVKPKNVNFTEDKIKEFRKAKREIVPKLCEKYAEEFPDLKEAYIKKSYAALAAFSAEIPDEAMIRSAISLCEDLLTKFEEDLKKIVEDNQGKPRWLCGNNITIADVYWGETLYRLEELGYDERFWNEGRRPHIQSYYDYVKHTDCFRACHT
ncbi:ganglioside-induced differentiation-associated protein 1-like [Saccoglossus kowalevskii]